MSTLKGDTEIKLIVQQDLILKNIDTLHSELLNSIDSITSKFLVLDLCQIQLLDSSGIKLIIGLYKSCQKRDISLRLRVASPTMVKVLSICKIDRFVQIEEVTN